MNNLISICIATYKRPLLLEKLLVSLLNQKNIDEYNIEIIIVDNDPDKTAEPMINKCKELIFSDSRYSIKYDVQPEKNISLTRNKTVELATGNYLYFIDDDEYADEYCLSNHLKVMKEFDADVTFGNVLPYFESNVSEIIMAAKPFYKLNSPDGYETKFLITSNTLLKIFRIKQYEVYFNPAFGITGGEDNDLFLRMKNRGFELKSASSAIVYEFIPVQRSNMIWLIKRVFRTGNNYTRSLLEHTNKKSSKIFTGIEHFFRGFIQAGISIILSILFLIINKEKSFNWFLKAISNFGKPFAVLGIYPKEYKK